jgi:hypothetical protein
MPLPILVQDVFPALPKGRAVRVAATKLGSGELEFAAAVIITACMQLGQWAPVSLFFFIEVLGKHPLFPLLGHTAFNSVRDLEAMGYIQIVREDNLDYIVFLPTISAVISDDNIIVVG